MFSIAGSVSFEFKSPFNMSTSAVNKTIFLIVLEGKLPRNELHCKSDVWLTVHRNSVWIRKTN